MWCRVILLGLKSCAFILQANLMEESYPIICPWQAPSATAAETTRDKSKCGHRARHMGAEEGQADAMPLERRRKKKTAAYFCHRGNVLCDSTCPSDDLRHSMTPLKQQGEQVRLDDNEERDGNFKEITHSGMRLEFQSDGSGVLKGLWWQRRGWWIKESKRGLLRETESSVQGKWGTVELRLFPLMNLSAGPTSMLMINTELKRSPEPKLQGNQLQPCTLRHDKGFAILNTVISSTVKVVLPSLCDCCVQLETCFGSQGSNLRDDMHFCSRMLSWVICCLAVVKCVVVFLKIHFLREICFYCL